MMTIRLFVALLPTITTFAVLAQPLTYQVQVDPLLKSQLHFSIDTRSLPKVTVLPPRSGRITAQPDLFCQRKGTSTPLDYHRETACDAITWQVNLPTVDPQGFDPSSQENSYSAKSSWYFVSEFNILPRIAGSNNAQVCTPQARCYPLKGEDAPPLYLLWGMPTATLNINGQPVTIHVEDQQVLQQKQRWLPTLERQLQYLQKVFPAQIQDWELAFFKREKEGGSIGGAAGSNLLLTNTLLEQGELTDESLRHLLKISAHESVHHIDKRALASWKAESLAEYYAQKSLFGSEFAFDTPDVLWQQMAKKFPFAKLGLYEAHRQVKELGNYQYYPLFYFKGAAFWYALDLALQAKGHSLDNLQNIDLGSQVQLSSDFTTQVIHLIGQEKWEALAHEFL